MVRPVTMKRLFVLTACVFGLFVSNIQVVAQQVSERQADLTSASAERKFEGRVVAEERVEFRNKTNQNLAIIWIVAEGTSVEKGDLLVQLDTSLIEDKISQSRIHVSTSKARLVKSESELESAKVSGETHKQELHAKLALLESREKIMFSKNGDIAVRREVLESTILVEAERIKLLQEKLSQFNAEEKSENLAYFELKFQRVESQSKSRIATTKLSHLNGAFEEHERNKIAFEKELSESEGMRNLAEAESKISKFKADVIAGTTGLQLAQAELDGFIDELQQCDILASQSGVVYYSDEDSHIMDLVVGEGEMLRPQQSILYLPNLDSLCIECEVPETVLDRVKKGQEVSISIDDGSDDLVGQVFSVANWPSSSRWGSDGEQFYKVIVRIADSERLKIGWTVQVKMNID